MKILILVLCTILTNYVVAQITEKERIIYGICNRDTLLKEPYSKWFNKGAADYIPNAETIIQLQKTKWKDYSIQIFFGSWCGDSKREVARFYKLIEHLNIDPQKIQLIGVGGSDSLYKQSPTGEDAGKGIFRVPVFIVNKNGKEVNRINEFPTSSLEKDLLQIINGEYIAPNYSSFSFINKWLLDGTLKDDNVNAAGLANQLRSKVNGEYELNSLAYLLLKQKMLKEALKVFKINYNLFPTSANVISSLGEGFLKNNEKDKAVTFLELALQENKDKAQFKGILDLLYEAKGVVKSK